MPENFLHVVGGLTLILGLLALIYSLFCDRKRGVGLKITGILFLITLASLANSFWVYFAAIFIIATLVTELDFLQNLAAIIRGSKEYFEYKSAEGIRSKIDNEIKSQETFIDQTKMLMLENRETLVQEYLSIERKTFD